MANITERDIVNSANSFEEASRAFNNAPPNSNLNYNTFLSLANKKFGVSSKTNTNSGATGAGVIKAASGVQGYTTGTGLVSADAEKELLSVTDLTEGLIGVGKAINQNKNIAGAFSELFKKGLSGLFEQSLQVIQDEVTLRNTLNAQIGISGELSRGYRDNINDARDGAAGMAYSFRELSTLAIDLNEQTGKFGTVNEKVLEGMAVTSRAFLGDLSKMGPLIREFELVGIGAEKTLDNINEAGKKSLSLGLNARATTEGLSKNLNRLNEFGFQNGVQGLASMVRKSIEFKINMDETFRLAEKVMSPEGAIDLAANLQVLGGAIGSLNDPYQMMYMATNNIEGLQDAIIGAAESLVTYNSEQGKFEISGVNLRRARALASELGKDYKELANTAIAAAERTSVATDLIAAGITVDDNQKEFITNLARMGSGGKMVIEVPPSIAKELGIARTQEIEDLDQATADKILQSQKQIEEMNIRDIALEQFTETQKGTLMLSEIAAMLKVEFARTYRDFGKDVDKALEIGRKSLGDYVTGEKQNLDIKAQIDKIRSDVAVEAKGNSNQTKPKSEKPTNVNKNQKGKPEENKALKVDNSKTETKEQPKTEDKTVSKEDLERILINVMTMNKNVNNGNFIIQNNIDETNPRSYTNVKSK